MSQWGARPRGRIQGGVVMGQRPSGQWELLGHLGPLGCTQGCAQYRAARWLVQRRAYDDM